MTDYYIENVLLPEVLTSIEGLFNDVSTTGNPHHFAYIGPNRRLTFNCMTATEVLGSDASLNLEGGMTQAEAKEYAIEHIDSLLSELFDPIVSKFKNHLDDPTLCFVIINRALFLYSHELFLLIDQEFGLHND